MSLRELAELPSWVWDLIEALHRYEDEHPPLYREGPGPDGYVRAGCVSGILDELVPARVRGAVRAYRAGKERAAEQQQQQPPDPADVMASVRLATATEGARAEISAEHGCRVFDAAGKQVFPPLPEGVQ
jgi:hypothetical protein